MMISDSSLKVGTKVGSSGYRHEIHAQRVSVHPSSSVAYYQHSQHVSASCVLFWLSRFELCPNISIGKERRCCGNINNQRANPETRCFGINCIEHMKFLFCGPTVSPDTLGPFLVNIKHQHFPCPLTTAPTPAPAPTPVFLATAWSSACVIHLSSLSSRSCPSRSLITSLIGTFTRPRLLFSNAFLGSIPLLWFLPTWTVTSSLLRPVAPPSDQAT